MLWILNRSILFPWQDKRFFLIKRFITLNILNCFFLFILFLLIKNDAHQIFKKNQNEIIRCDVIANKITLFWRVNGVKVIFTGHRTATTDELNPYRTVSGFALVKKKFKVIFNYVLYFSFYEMSSCEV